MIVIVFNFALKLSFMKLWQLAVISLVVAVVVGMSWPWAIEQSKSQIAEWLANQPLMLDTSVVLTIEVAWQVAYCMLSAHIMYEGVVRRRVVWTYRVLRFFPGILIFPVLFSALVALIYAFPGYDFKTLSWLMAAGIVVVMPMVAVGIRALLPEKPLRLEVMFLSNALVLILGVIATVNGTTTFHGSDEVDWMALGAFGVLMAVCAGVGMAIYYFKNLKTNK